MEGGSALYKFRIMLLIFIAREKNNLFTSRNSWKSGKTRELWWWRQEPKAVVKKRETDRTRLRVQNEESKMGGRRRWKEKKRGQGKGKKLDRDKWPWEMAGAGEHACETALSAALTQTDRTTGHRYHSNPFHFCVILPLFHTKKNKKHIHTHSNSPACTELEEYNVKELQAAYFVFKSKVLYFVWNWTPGRKEMYQKIIYI